MNGCWEEPRIATSPDASDKAYRSVWSRDSGAVLAAAGTAERPKCMQGGRETCPPHQGLTFLLENVLDLTNRCLVTAWRGGDLFLAPPRR